MKKEQHFPEEIYRQLKIQAKAGRVDGVVSKLALCNADQKKAVVRYGRYQLLRMAASQTDFNYHQVFKALWQATEQTAYARYRFWQKFPEYRKFIPLPQTTLIKQLNLYLNVRNQVEKNRDLTAKLQTCGVCNADSTLAMAMLYFGKSPQEIQDEKAKICSYSALQMRKLTTKDADYHLFEMWLSMMNFLQYPGRVIADLKGRDFEKLLRIIAPAKLTGKYSVLQLKPVFRFAAILHRNNLKDLFALSKPGDIIRINNPKHVIFIDYNGKSYCLHNSSFDYNFIITDDLNNLSKMVCYFLAIKDDSLFESAAIIMRIFNSQTLGKIDRPDPVSLLTSYYRINPRMNSHSLIDECVHLEDNSTITFDVSVVTNLLLAIKSAMPEIAIAHIKAGADVHVRDVYWDTVLHIAAGHGFLELVNTLLKTDADVDAENYLQITPLHKAVYYRYLNIVIKLLKANANVDAENYDQDTPLHMAAEQGHYDIAKTLIAYDADVTATNGQHATPLHLAAAHGRLSIVKLLIKQDNVDIDARAEMNVTALYWAAQIGHVNIVDELVRAGADPNARNINQCTPLLNSVIHGRIKVVEYLLTAGADLTATNNVGYTALHIAVISKQPKMVATLLNAGIDVNKPDNKGMTAVDYANRANNTEILSLLTSSIASLESIAKPFTSFRV